ncbi:MAG: alpha/beta fold hydrolase [Oscillospiraceae bacterium]|nr:alpha/beta fold hydrolase [Oscillospiraceae bacterium]
MSLLIREKFSFKSSNGKNTINGFIICKENAPYKAVVQISHGMTEHSQRYVDFMEFMAQQGFVMVIHDHLGHRDSVDGNKADLGYFAPKDGYKCVLSDLATTAGMVKKKFPQLKLFLLGHSMGSFYARVFAAKYPYLADGVILSGTGGPNPMAGPGLALVALLTKIYGDRHRSKFMVKVTFGSYLKKIENPKSSRDWLTRDNDYIQKYRKDEYCSFIFTLSGYKDLITIIRLSNSEECYRDTNKEIPYFIFSGDMDPVGEWGKGVRTVYGQYQKYVKDVTLKLYPEGRHEMLNEINRDEVYSDVLNWIESKI